MILGVGIGSFELITAPASVFGFQCGALKLSLYRDNGQTGVDMYIRIEDNQNVPSPMIKVRSSYLNVESEWKTVTLT